MTTETGRKIRLPLERIIWVGLIGLAIYAAIIGTTWYRNYEEAQFRAEAIPQLEAKAQALSQTIEERNAEIERLKQIPLR